MSDVTLTTRSSDYSADPLPQNKVNAVSLDVDVDQLYLNDQRLKAGLDKITRDDGELKDGIIRYRMLHAEVIAHLASKNGWQPKVQARLATTANIALTGTQTIDGTACIVGDRILVKAQTDARQNGIYVVAAGAWSRASDCDNNSEVPQAAVFVTAGSALANTGWVVQETSVTLGTTAITWVRIPAGAGGGGGSGNAVDPVLATGTSQPRFLADRFTDFVNVLDFGAQRDMSVDASPKFLDAFNSGAQTIVVPAGNYLFQSPLVIPAYKRVYGLPGSVIHTDLTTGAMHLNTGSVIEGIDFENRVVLRSAAVGVYAVNLSQNWEVKRCRFFSFGTGIAISGEQRAREGRIESCRIESWQYGIYLRASVRNQVLNNECFYNGRHIIFHGGGLNTVANNRTLGGIVGIGFFSSRNFSGFHGRIYANNVVGNHVSQPSEEGITFDCLANVPDAWPENPINPLVTVSGVVVEGPTSIRINLSEGGQAPGWANAYQAIGMHGTTLGQLFEIYESGAGYIKVYRSNGNPGNIWAVGDKILITLAMSNNNVVGNQLYYTGTSGILMYGSSWHSQIIGNTIHDARRDGIWVASVFANLVGSGVPWGSQSWSGFCKVIGNTVNLMDRGANFTTPGAYNAFSQGGISATSQIYGTVGIPAALVRNPGHVFTHNNVDAGLSKPAWFRETNGLLLEHNNLSGDGEILLQDTKTTRFGRNWRRGQRYKAPLTSGTNTGLINELMPVLAPLGGGASLADVIAHQNQLVANLVAAGHQDI